MAQTLKGAQQLLALVRRQPAFSSGVKNYGEPGQTVHVSQNTFGANVAGPSRVADNQINLTQADNLQQFNDNITENDILTDPVGSTRRIYQQLNQVAPIRTGIFTTPAERSYARNALNQRLLSVLDYVQKIRDAQSKSQGDSADAQLKYQQQLARDQMLSQQRIAESKAIDEAKRQAEQQPLLNAAERDIRYDPSQPFVGPYSKDELARRAVEDAAYRRYQAEAEQPALDVAGKRTANQAAEINLATLPQRNVAELEGQGLINKTAQRNLQQARVYNSAAGPVIQNPDNSLYMYPVTPANRTPAGSTINLQTGEQTLTPASVAPPTVGSPVALQQAGAAQPQQPQAQQAQQPQGQPSSLKQAAIRKINSPELQGPNRVQALRTIIDLMQQRGDPFTPQELARILKPEEFYQLYAK